MRIFAKQNFALCGIRTTARDWAASGLNKIYLTWCSMDPEVTFRYEELVFSEFLPGLNIALNTISEEQLEEGEKFLFGQAGCDDDSGCKGNLTCSSGKCIYGVADGTGAKCENG